MKRVALALVVVAGCAQRTEIDLTLVLAGAAAARAHDVATVEMKVTGDLTPFDKRIDATGKFAGGSATIAYRPGVKSGSLQFDITIRDAAGNIIATVIASASVQANASTPIQVMVGPAALDGGGDGGATDMEHPDLFGAPPAAPRLLAPLSGSYVSRRTPTLRWQLNGDDDGARVDVCADRACANVLRTVDAPGSSVALAAPDLPSGPVFWRARGLRSGAAGTASSATWEFFAGKASAAADTWYGCVLDLDGDGYADVAAGEPGSDPPQILVWLGSSGGPASTPVSVTVPKMGQTGQFVAAAGDVNGDGLGDLIVGSANNSVFVFLGAAGGVNPTPTEIMVAASSVASAGDVNGDGFADVIVGQTNGGMGGAGAAFVYFGSAKGTVTSPFFGVDGRSANDKFGDAVAGLGDVNGDGFGDIAVGEAGNDRVDVYFGAANSTLGATPLDGGTLPAANAVIAVTNYTGLTLAGGGDYDGDGYPDLVVGALGQPYDGTMQKAGPGTAYLFLLTPTALQAALTPAVTFNEPSGVDLDGFAQSVSIGGDVTGDGLADVLIGAGSAPYAAAAGPGKAFLFAGQSSAAITAQPAPTGNVLAGATAGDQLGAAVSIAGDVSNDGFADVVIGAPGAMSGMGSIAIYAGSGTGVVTGAALRSAAGSASGALGTSIAARVRLKSRPQLRRRS